VARHDLVLLVKWSITRLRCSMYWRTASAVVEGSFADPFIDAGRAITRACAPTNPLGLFKRGRNTYL
jgi:hypothetical protein